MLAVAGLIYFLGFGACVDAYFADFSAVFFWQSELKGSGMNDEETRLSEIKERVLGPSRADWEQFHSPKNRWRSLPRHPDGTSCKSAREDMKPEDDFQSFLMVGSPRRSSY